MSISGGEEDQIGEDADSRTANGSSRVIGCGNRCAGPATISPLIGPHMLFGAEILSAPTRRGKVPIILDGKTLEPTLIDVPLARRVVMGMGSHRRGGRDPPQKASSACLRKIRAREFPRFRAWYSPPASSARGGRGIPTAYQVPKHKSMSPDPFDLSHGCACNGHWTLRVFTSRYGRRTTEAAFHASRTVLNWE